MRVKDCPSAHALQPLFLEAAPVYARMTAWPGVLPRAGGLEEQDALLMHALDVLSGESVHIRSAVLQVTRGQRQYSDHG